MEYNHQAHLRCAVARHADDRPSCPLAVAECHSSCLERHRCRSRLGLEYHHQTGMGCSGLVPAKHLRSGNDLDLAEHCYADLERHWWSNQLGLEYDYQTCLGCSGLVLAECSCAGNELDLEQYHPAYLGCY